MTYEEWLIQEEAMTARIERKYEEALKKYRKKRDDYLLSYLRHIYFCCNKASYKALKSKTASDAMKKGEYWFKIFSNRRFPNIGPGELEHWQEDPENVQFFEVGEFSPEEQDFIHKNRLKVEELSPYSCLVPLESIWDIDFLHTTKKRLGLDWLMETRSGKPMNIVAKFGLKEGLRIVNWGLIK